MRVEAAKDLAYFRELRAITLIRPSVLRFVFLMLYYDQSNMRFLTLASSVEVRFDVGTLKPIGVGRMLQATLSVARTLGLINGRNGRLKSFP